jgi:autotransporter passenger strand-loop-strand repeat protein
VSNSGTLVEIGSAIVAGASFSAGIEILIGGATQSGGTLSGTGLLQLILSSGGIASGVTVSSGGFEIVSSGGTASGGTVYSGGTLVVHGGGTVSGVSFSAAPCCPAPRCRRAPCRA